ncbi:MAG: hypothetical protein KDD48_02760 [Bdellovibrionales bacterium]|nr:hypothetical protein [Bdellovibrionales bacterium]
MRHGTLILLLFALFTQACSEAPLFTSDPNKRLNYPISMVLVPGSNLALVANANANLNQSFGSLFAIDLDSRSLLIETKLDLPAFSGRMVIDGTSNRLYIANKDTESVLVYEYSVPGNNGAAISFEEVSVMNPANRTVNGLRTDESPFDMALIPNAPQGPLMYTSNIASGSVSVSNVSTLETTDLNPSKPDLYGLPLISSANFRDVDLMPGIGAYRFALEPNQGRLLYVTSSRVNSIYVVDTFAQNIEAMIDLSFLSNTPGTRGITISSSGLAYVAVPALQIVAILDVSAITDNGMDYEVLEPQLIGFIPVGEDPESVALSADELTLYVLNQGDPSLDLIDLPTRTKKTRTLLESAISPADFILNAPRDEIYVLGYLSNRISVLNLTTGSPIANIE